MAAGLLLQLWRGQCGLTCLQIAFAQSAPAPLHALRLPTHAAQHTDQPPAQERRFAQLEDALAARESKREAYLVVSFERVPFFLAFLFAGVTLLLTFPVGVALCASAPRQLAPSLAELV